MLDNRIKINVKLPAGKTRPLLVPPDVTAPEILQALSQKGALGGREPDEFEARIIISPGEGQLLGTPFKEGDLVEIIRKPTRLDLIEFADGS